MAEPESLRTVSDAELATVDLGEFSNDALGPVALAIQADLRGLDPVDLSRVAGTSAAERVEPWATAADSDGAAWLMELVAGGGQAAQRCQRWMAPAAIVLEVRRRAALTVNGHPASPSG